MNAKIRLQRVLHILDGVERVETLSAIDRELVLSELREVYSAVRFGEIANSPIVPDAPVPPVAEPQHDVCEADEPAEKEVEVELIFEDDEQEVEEKLKQKVAEKPAAESKPNVTKECDAEPFRPHHSAIMSLYEDEATHVVAEQFHEAPSVADTIPCPKGVAESATVSSLREAIGLADKFMLINDLFDGDVDAYEQAIDALDGQTSFEDCMIYISEHYVWRAQSDAVQIMMSLLHRRYNE